MPQLPTGGPPASDLRLTPLERRAVAVLALVYALRMVGMFMVLPVMALHARSFEGPVTGFQIGLAVGVYALAQALLQVPLGWLSDRIGRRPVVLGGLLVFAAGSFLAAQADTIEALILARTLQGLGAVSAAVSAWLADLTRPAVRSTAMAVVGIAVGGSFIAAMVSGPSLAAWVGVDGLFTLTGFAVLACLPLVAFALPAPAPTPAAPGRLAQALRDPALLRLDAGILLLHATLAALFVGLPILLVDAHGWAEARHWQLYLPVLLLSVLPVFPLIRFSERRGWLPQVMALCGLGLAAALAVLALGGAQFTALGVGLLLFFVAFNFLEGALPAQVSRQAPPEAKGAALGAYATCQFIGGFLGAAAAGWALGRGGPTAVFALALALPVLWILIAVPRPGAPVGSPPTAEESPHGSRRQ